MRGMPVGGVGGRVNESRERPRAPSPVSCSLPAGEVVAGLLPNLDVPHLRRRGERRGDLR